MVTEADWKNWKEEDFSAYLDIIFDAFGPKRVMIGSGENKTLICYVNYFELQKVKTIISENKGTFSTVSTIEEILR